MFSLFYWRLRWSKEVADDWRKTNTVFKKHSEEDEGNFRSINFTLSSWKDHGENPLGRHSQPHEKQNKGVGTTSIHLLRANHAWPTQLPSTMRWCLWWMRRKQWILYTDFGNASVTVSQRILPASSGTTSGVLGSPYKKNTGILEWVHWSGSGSHNMFVQLQDQQVNRRPCCFPQLPMRCKANSQILLKGIHWKDKWPWTQGRTCEIPTDYRLVIFHHEDGQALEQDAQ